MICVRCCGKKIPFLLPLACSAPGIPSPLISGFASMLSSFFFPVLFEQANKGYSFLYFSFIFRYLILYSWNSALSKCSGNEVSCYQYLLKTWMCQVTGGSRVLTLSEASQRPCPQGAHSWEGDRCQAKGENWGRCGKHPWLLSPVTPRMTWGEIAEEGAKGQVRLTGVLSVLRISFWTMTRNVCVYLGSCQPLGISSTVAMFDINVPV